MVIVPTRWPLWFLSTLNETEPFPVPLSPDRIEIHETLLTAVHEQPAVAVTVMFMPFPPFGPIDWLVGAMEYMHGGGGAGWVTVNICPAIVSVPIRCAPVFAVALYATVPPPVPLAPLVIVSHGALLVAVQAQPAVVVTVTGEPAPPLAASVALPGAIE
jgi:hypothetical protein